MLPCGSYVDHAARSAPPSASAGSGRCPRPAGSWPPRRRLEVDVRAGVARSVERQGLRVGVDVRARRVRARQVRERPEARQRHGQRPPLGGAVGAVLGADVGDQRLAVGTPEDGRRSPTRLGRATDGGAAHRIQRGGRHRQRGQDARRQRRGPRVGRSADDASAWSGATTPPPTGRTYPAALITIMVAMAATTRPTGTSAVRTGWRVRNLAALVGVAVDASSWWRCGWRWWFGAVSWCSCSDSVAGPRPTRRPRWGLRHGVLLGLSRGGG